MLQYRRRSVNGRSCNAYCVCFMNHALHSTYCAGLELGLTDHSGQDLQHLRERLVFKLHLPRPASTVGRSCSRVCSCWLKINMLLLYVLAPLCIVGLLIRRLYKIEKLPRRAWASVSEIYMLAVFATLSGIEPRFLPLWLWWYGTRSVPSASSTTGSKNRDGRRVR